MTTARNLFAAAAVAALSLSSAAPLLGQNIYSPSRLAFATPARDYGNNMIGAINNASLDVRTTRRWFRGPFYYQDSTTADLDVRNRVRLVSMKFEGARVQASASRVFNRGTANVDVELLGNTRWSGPQASIQRSGALRLPRLLSTDGFGKSVPVPFLAAPIYISTFVGVTADCDMTFDLGDGRRYRTSSNPYIYLRSSPGELGLLGSASTKATFTAGIGVRIPFIASAELRFEGDLAEQRSMPDIIASVRNGIRPQVAVNRGVRWTHVFEEYKFSLKLVAWFLWMRGEWTLLGPFKGNAESFTF